MQRAAGSAVTPRAPDIARYGFQPDEIVNSIADLMAPRFFATAA